MSEAPLSVPVAVPVPLRACFSYAVRPGDDPQPGARVQVRFGPRRLVGVVVGPPTTELPDGLDPAKLRPYERLIDPCSEVPPALLELAAFVADYYVAPPGMAYPLVTPPEAPPRKAGSAPAVRQRTWVVRTAAPRPDRALGVKMAAALGWLEAAPGGEGTLAALKGAVGADRAVARRLEERGLVRLEDRDAPRDPLSRLGPIPRDAPPTLRPGQAAAVDAVTGAFGRYEGFLLRGITGSGKTEVYLHIIDSALAAGLGGALVLVPEIALTPQLVGRFRARLGDRVAVLHSGLDRAARREQWHRIRRGELDVVVGARSAVFAPLERVGVVVVDEAHDGSFKQDPAPSYHGRDLALVRGRLEGCPVVLGTATPSVESWHNVSRGKLTLLELTERAGGHALPEVELVDLRAEPTVDEDGLMSAILVRALRETVDRGEQAIVLLNRRGWAAFLLCRACGERVECPECSVAYTWHRGRGQLVCHLSDHVAPRPHVCPSCGEAALEEVGAGTERAVDGLERELPGARIGRMDRDTTRGHALIELVGRFRRRELDVLVGTQMVAKGHDFPGVTLVGVLLADQGLGLPDLRAGERTFQLLTQVTGRAGRAARPGRVLVQTFAPEHEVLQLAARQDTVAFLDEELEARRARGFPPHRHLAMWRVSATDRTVAESWALKVARWARVDATAGGQVTVLEPQPAVLERIKGRWRFQVLAFGDTRGALRRVLEGVTARVGAERVPSQVQVTLDVDPHSMM